MDRDKLIEYEQRSVRIKYTTETGMHSQAGTLYAVGIYTAIFLPINDDEEDIESLIKIKDIKNIWELKGVNE